MAKAKRRQVAVMEKLDEPTAEQMQHSAYEPGAVMHVETARAAKAYRKVPVIDRLLRHKLITKMEWEALAYYADRANLAEKSPVRSNCDFSVRGSGDGPGAAILSAMLETGRIERDLGSLYDIARFIAVEDKALSQWCIHKWGGRERYDGAGKFIAIVPICEKRHMAIARLELRMAARRIRGLYT